MACPSATFVGINTPNQSVTNWNGDVNFTVEQFWEPAHDDSAGSASGLSALVRVVVDATAAGKRLMTTGSAWAFENNIQPDHWLISLKQLDRRLGYVTDAGGQALNNTWRDRQAEPGGARRLIHVEAGIEVGGLIDLLAANPDEPWAMPVLGGANGQSLGGVISTSTHGGDWQQPPLADVVRAIHLVTDGGRELWIERASEPITTNDRLQPVLPCADTEVVRDDEVFNAVLVSAGRFGVVYAFVLEVTQAFNVAEVVTMVDREAALSSFTAGASAARPLDPLIALLATAPLPTTLQVTAEAVGDPYYVQLVFNSLDTTQCWAQRRWRTSQSEPLNAVDPDVSQVLVWLALGAINFVWAVGANPSGLVNHQLAGRFELAMTQGRRGPHHLLTSGTRAGSHNIPYKADSIEVIFAANDPRFVLFLRSVLYESQTFKQAGYISIRPSLASKATMSMHNVESTHAYSVECSTLKVVPDAERWMQFVHYQALAHGGRPHWGQYNKMDARWVSQLYGKRLHRWHHALWKVSRASDRFSTDFTRQRGLDPTALRRVTAVFRTAEGTLTHLVGAEGESWSPVSVRDAIAGIRNNTALYVIETAQALSFLAVVNNPRAGGLYLRAERDGATADNLAALPLAAGPAPTVGDESEFVVVDCPPSIRAGESASARVVMMNSGTSIWTRGHVALMSAPGSGVGFAPVPVDQTTSAFQNATFVVPIAPGAVGTRARLVCQLSHDGRPFGSETEPRVIVFTALDEPAACADIRERMAQLQASITLLTDSLDPDGDVHEQARIRKRIADLKTELAKNRAAGTSLGCTLP